MTTKFGDIAKKLRLQNNLTQDQLAQVLSVGRPTIAGYETKGKQPDYDKLVKLANYFNVSIDYLLGNTQNSYSSTSQLSIGTAIESTSLYNENLVQIDLELKALVNKLTVDHPSILFNGTSLNEATIIALRDSLTNIINMITAMSQCNNSNENENLVKTKA